MPKSVTLTLGVPRERTSADRGFVQFIGTATALVELGPFAVLTDPNFLHAGDRAHLGYGGSSERLTDPAVELEDLPPLDACVLSHLHGDHWDEVASSRLPKDLPVLTTPHAARTLRKRGFSRAHGLATWDQAVLRRGSAWLRVTAVPAQHGPQLLAALLPPVMGSMWELGVSGGEPRFRLYVSGDTLAHDGLLEIPARFPHVDLGLLHLGGARILGFLVTMDAAQGIEAIRTVQPDLAIPVHYDDYAVFGSSLDEFAAAVADAGLAHRVRYLQRGERHAFLIARGGVQPFEALRAARAGTHPVQPQADPRPLRPGS
jgi:L-ascorbate metabolism protein UlaG (beta-lactamase superfamily)